MTYSNGRSFLVGVASLGLISCATTSVVSTPASTPASLGFVAVGDTGHLAEDSGITAVSHAVHKYCADQGCQFGLMAGDNIYPDGAAADAGDEEMFRTRFVEPYGPMAELSESFRMFVTLGNHDWRTSKAGALAQVAFHENTQPFYMDGLFYSAKPTAFNGDLEVFVIDTEMLLAGQKVVEYDNKSDGSMVANGKVDTWGNKTALPTSDAEKQQLAWFKNAIKNSTAKWKIVLAHHPLWQSRSDSKYEQSIKLRELLLPTLCQYADTYVAGHQHTQELHTDSCTGGAPDASIRPLVHIVSGAGSKARKVDTKFQAWQKNKYPQLDHIWAMGDQWGFTYLSVEQDQLEVRMINVSADGHINVAVTHSFKNRP